MAARIKDGVEVTFLDRGELHGVRQYIAGLCVRLEPAGLIGLKARLVALRVERGLAAIRRCQDDLESSILEDVVGGGKLLEPEACLAAGIAELIVRCQNYQNLHGHSLWGEVWRDSPQVAGE